MIREDIAALAAISRDSAGPGEVAAAELCAARLRDAGVADVAVERYRWPRTYAWTHLLHALAGLGPRWLSALAAVSYELESSGRLQWLPRLLPKGEGANVVARIPARADAVSTGNGGSADGAPRRLRTVVLVAHLDAQKAGWMWSPKIIEAGAKGRVKRRAMSPASLPLLVALALRLRPVALVSVAAMLDTIRRPTVPGANDNASGVAAVLDVARRVAADPIDDADVLVVLPGAEEAGMGGMRAFLDAHALDPATTFVVGLDTVGSGEPVVVGTEGALLGRYRDEDLARFAAAVERAGLPAPPRWRIAGWTDPILARFRGIPAVSVLSVDPATGMYTRYHRMDDLPEHVDLHSVERCARLAEAAARGLTA